MLNRLISIAPMMDWTDRHYRVLMRCITKKVLLYTEMINAKAIVYGDAASHLQNSPVENPLALQLGGSDPKELAHASAMAQDYGYDEINLNVGCPSSRVQSGAFGACLMKQPELVAACVKAMQQAVSIPITVKTRIGVDDLDQYSDLTHFVSEVAAIGCNSFTIHARKAWLSGLSPKENRTIPPLQYDRVYQLKADFPQLEIILNGGVKTIADIQRHLTIVDGVMVGREAYHNPYFLAEFDRLFFNASTTVPTREEILEAYIPYVKGQLEQGVRLHCMTRHMLNLFHGQPNGRQWRRELSEHAPRYGAGIDVLERAIDAIFE